MNARLTLIGLACVSLLAGGCGQLEAMRAAGPAKRVVAATLKDPASAQWGSIWSYGGVICGYVNAKNSFGAYPGHTRFFVSGTLPQLEGGPLGDEFGDYWSVNCARAEYTVARGQPEGPSATGPRSSEQITADTKALIALVERHS